MAGYLQGPAAAVGVLDAKVATAPFSKGMAAAELKVLLLLLLVGANDSEVAHELEGIDCLRTMQSDCRAVLALLLKEAAVPAMDGARLAERSGCGRAPSTASGHLATNFFKPGNTKIAFDITNIVKHDCHVTCGRSLA